MTNRVCYRLLKSGTCNSTLFFIQCIYDAGRSSVQLLKGGGFIRYLKQSFKL